MKFLSLTLLTITLLASCSPQIPECSDPKIKETVIQLVFEKLATTPSALLNKTDIAKLNSQEIKNMLTLQNARAKAMDKEIRKYSCLGTLEYSLGKPENLVEGLEKTENLGQLASLIDGHNGNQLHQASNAIRSVYSQADQKLKMDIAYSVQLIGNDEDYVEFFADKTNISGFQFSLFIDTAGVEQEKSEEAIADHPFIKVDEQAEPVDSNSETDLVKLSTQEINIIKNMVKKFKRDYEDGGILKVRDERQKCYEAAKQILDITLSTECIAQDVVACVSIPIIDKQLHFPIEADYTEEACSKRTLEAGSVVYTTERKASAYVSAIARRTAQETLGHKK